jgi:hypothetical protein
MMGQDVFHDMKDIERQRTEANDGQEGSRANARKTVSRGHARMANE